ncbi:MAG TPA: hypothetical protein VMA77_05065 [Solirubrobacteraceae bacterium]|nr:hypothetical protein [Solirubrobacteraceae bacterium]
MRWAQLARQPALGLAGVTLVIPVMVVLGVGLGGAQNSLATLGPLSTFALPVIAMIAFWWEDWPGTMLRAPLTGLIDTLLVILAGVLFTIAGQAIVSHVDLRGVFDPTAGVRHATTFPATMPLAAAVFAAVLELTLVSEGWPLRRLNRFAGGIAALAVAWGFGILLYETLVADAGGPVSRGQFGAALVCVAVLQVAFYVLLRGWPFCRIPSRPLRLASANLFVIAGGVGACVALHRWAGLDPATVSAVAGAAVAAGLVIGMLFEGWLDSVLAPPHARLASAIGLAIGTAVLYVGLRAYAGTTDFTHAGPQDWVAYAALNAIGAGVILHVAIGRRWPFGSPVGSRALT